MICTFGYMSIAIIFKWLKNWGDGANAPAILSIFINMGFTEPKQNLFGDEAGKEQTELQ